MWGLMLLILILYKNIIFLSGVFFQGDERKPVSERIFMKSEKFSEVCEQFIQTLQTKRTLVKKEEEILEKVIMESQKLLESTLDSKKSRIKKGLVQQLDKAIDQFEGSHPSLTANMEKMVEMLNQMGI